MGIGTVITVSTRVLIDDLERMTRARVARDGVAPLVAVSGRQRAHLLRLRKRLLADPGLKMSGGTVRPDGTTHLIVFAAGQRPPVGWFGGPKTDVAEDPDGDYWSVPETS